MTFLSTPSQMYFSDGSLVPSFLSVEQVAQLFNISEDNVYKAIKDNVLYARRFSARQYRIAQADAIAWFNAER